MCHCVHSPVTISNGGLKFRELEQFRCNSRTAFLPVSGIAIGFGCCSIIAKPTKILSIPHVKNWRGLNRREKPMMNVKVCSNLGLFDSNGFDFSPESRLKKGKDEKFDVGFGNGRDYLKDFIAKSEDDDLGLDNLMREKQKSPKYEVLREDKGVVKGEDLVGIENGKHKKLKKQLKLQQRKGKELMNRSSLVAKQVIGIQSALSFGFVSQLWVDTVSWTVLEVEVRPNLLSSESGKFLLEDIKQIGDVVLVPDDRIMSNVLRTVGLETLVGYHVVTPGQGHLGKVRGYTLNINSGAVESLELDAFGYSIIPSSLVSTYALSTEDVLEVVSDTIIVHEAAASHIQRLTKGFLGTKSMDISNMNLTYDNLEEESQRPIKGRKSRRKSNKRKFYQGISDLDDDLELPMDYM